MKKLVSGLQTDTPQEQVVEGWKKQVEVERQIVLCTQQPQLPQAERPAGEPCPAGTARDCPQHPQEKMLQRRLGCEERALGLCGGDVLAVTVLRAGGECTPRGHPLQAGPTEEVTGSIFNSKI